MITSAWHTQIEKVHLVLASQRLFLLSCAYDWNRANFSLIIKVLRQFFCVGWLKYITDEKDAEHDSILKGRICGRAEESAGQARSFKPIL